MPTILPRGDKGKQDGGGGKAITLIQTEWIDVRK